MSERSNQRTEQPSKFAPWNSIGVKLFIGIFVSTALLLGFFAYIGMRRSTQVLTRSSEQHAAETAAIIGQSLRYSMLLNRKDDLHASLQNIARDPAVQSLRLYDKNGRIVFSTEHGEMGRRVKREADACVPCHAGSGLTKNVQRPPATTVQGTEQAAYLLQIYPIKNETQCSTARCHQHSPERTVLGILDLRMSLETIELEQKRARKTIGLAGLLLALIGAFGSGLFIWRFVKRPVDRLTEGTRRVAAGDLDVRIQLDEGGEFRELGAAFNRMTEDLSRARKRAEQWEGELETAVREKTATLGRAQERLARMEKLASLGKLAATVAHELNNPLAGILVYAKLIQRELDTEALTPETRQEMRRFLDVIAQESSRCGEIVRNLLIFSRESKLSVSEQRLNVIAERSLMTVRHLFEGSAISWQLEACSGDDAFLCDGNQIQQALVALLVNAVEAMPTGGKLVIRARCDAEFVRIEVEDSGTGISPDVLPSIFEPFVSTKGEQSGVGLGLAVAYGVIRRHEGNIEVESVLGAGALFRVILPRRPQQSGSTLFV